MQCARERVELNVLDFEQLEVRVRQRVRAKLMVELYHTADSLATSLSTLEHPNATQPAAAPTTPSQPNTLADVCAHRPMRRFD